uniref:ORF46 n=1 Tax=Nitrosopumilaceae spindle-shaped virus TaxID=3065433 RepID=A0AAT9J7N0_9VIRU
MIPNLRCSKCVIERCVKGCKCPCHGYRYDKFSGHGMIEK